MTKEQILDKIENLPKNYIGERDLTRREFAIVAMDEYAKQQSIEFLKWAVENHSVDYEGFSLNQFTPSSGKEPTVYVGSLTKFKELSLAEFYDLFTNLLP